MHLLCSEIAVLPVFSQARNTKSAAFLTVFFHSFAGSLPEAKREQRAAIIKTRALSRNSVTGIQHTVFSLVSLAVMRIEAALVVTASVPRMSVAGEMSQQGKHIFST